MDLFRIGLIGFTRGLRRGNPALVAAGLAATIIGFMRRRPKRGPTVLYSAELRPGDEITVRLPED